jgi:hypothetical protein
MREFMIYGPDGAVKAQSIWNGENLITVILFGGKE